MRVAGLGGPDGGLVLKTCITRHRNFLLLLGIAHTAALLMELPVLSSSSSGVANRGGFNARMMTSEPLKMTLRSPVVTLNKDRILM